MGAAEWVFSSIGRQNMACLPMAMDCCRKNNVQRTKVESVPAIALLPERFAQRLPTNSESPQPEPEGWRQPRRPRPGAFA